MSEKLHHIADATAVITSTCVTSSLEEGILCHSNANNITVMITALTRDLRHFMVLRSYVAQYLIFLKADEILSASLVSAAV
jgi:hypothetical protein